MTVAEGDQLSLTFLPPEEVRSGFTESAFSLLDDLDLLLFSFSADSGESEVGLELLLFLEASGNETLSCVNFYCSCSADSSFGSVHTMKHLLVPFSSFRRLASWLVSRSLTVWS